MRLLEPIGRSPLHKGIELCIGATEVSDEDSQLSFDGVVDECRVMPSRRWRDSHGPEGYVSKRVE